MVNRLPGGGIILTHGFSNWERSGTTNRMTESVNGHKIVIHTLTIGAIDLVNMHTRL